MPVRFLGGEGRPILVFASPNSLRRGSTERERESLFARIVHNGLREAERKPNNPPEISGRLTQSVIKRRNDYVQARARYSTMMDWERADLVLNMGTLLSQCERDVQERMLWRLFLIHDEYGARVGEHLGMTAADVKHLEPLAGQVLIEEDKARLQKLGQNGDVIDPNVWGKHTSSVKNYQASAEEVLGGGLTVPADEESEEGVGRSAGS